MHKENIPKIYEPEKVSKGWNYRTREDFYLRGEPYKQEKINVVPNPYQH
jgi:hypothetical protein